MVVAVQLEMHIAQGNEPFGLVGFEGHGHFVELGRLVGLAQGQVNPAQRSQHLAGLRMALPRLLVRRPCVRIALLPQQGAANQQRVLHRRRLHYRRRGRRLGLGLAASDQRDAECE